MDEKEGALRETRKRDNCILAEVAAKSWKERWDIKEWKQEKERGGIKRVENTRVNRKIRTGKTRRFGRKGKYKVREKRL